MQGKFKGCPVHGRRKTLPGAYVLHKVYMVLNSLAQTGVPPAVHRFIDPFTYPLC